MFSPIPPPNFAKYAFSSAITLPSPGFAMRLSSVGKIESSKTPFYFPDVFFMLTFVLGLGFPM
jgi:hypothetical protein